MIYIQCLIFISIEVIIADDSPKSSIKTQAMNGGNNSSTTTTSKPNEPSSTTTGDSVIISFEKFNQ